MWKFLFCNALISAVVFSAENIEIDTLNNQKLEPGLGAPMKLWWVKEVTTEYYVAGRLTPRWIKYASEGGFKSIVSLYNNKDSGEFSGEYLPTTQEAREIATQAGVQYTTVFDEDGKDEWASKEGVAKVTEVLSNMPTPVLVCATYPNTAAFTTLLYVANRTRYDSDFASKVPLVTSERFYRAAAALGFDYTPKCYGKVVSEITGESPVEDPLKPNVNPGDWWKYWPAHAVYGNWFTAGQIRTGDIEEIRKAGFKTVINMRQGTTLNGQPSQEAVTLLNIRDTTPTYGDSELGPRQQAETLKSIVLDPTRDKTYICPESKDNFESRNYGEFGDEMGYNETVETIAFEEVEFPYIHMPVEFYATYTPELFESYKDKLLEIGKSGPVLVHCARAKRAAFLSVLAAAIQYDKSLSWALKRVKELGFDVTTPQTKDRYNMFHSWLDGKSSRNEL